MILLVPQIGRTILSLFLLVQFSVVLSFLNHPKYLSTQNNVRFHPNRVETNLDATDPSFSELGIHPSILNAISSRSDWEQPTPVQQLAIPRLVEQGSNDAFWCEAPTGSGKTAAYLIPLLQNILIVGSKKQKGERVSAMILCPTRELCIQIGSVLDGLISDIVSMDRRSQYQISSMVLHGGIPVEPQIARLADCVRYHTTIDILVATPGRLIDVLTSYEGNSNAQDAAMEKRLLAAIENTHMVMFRWTNCKN